MDVSNISDRDYYFYYFILLYFVLLHHIAVSCVWYVLKKKHMKELKVHYHLLAFFYELINDDKMLNMFMFLHAQYSGLCCCIEFKKKSMHFISSTTKFNIGNSNKFKTR